MYFAFTQGIIEQAPLGSWAVNRKNINFHYRESERVRLPCANRLFDVVFSEIMIRDKGITWDFNVSGIYFETYQFFSASQSEVPECNCKG
ncbi:MAG TPA: hypothetical protein DCZ97_08515 [Syntrophus sp. (in: bacteria)]|nr:hypothetical protein [Syntrophus sp. (in: bacteria)]